MVGVSLATKDSSSLATVVVISFASESVGEGVPELLQFRFVGVWRRACRSALAAGYGGIPGLGDIKRVPGRLWRGTGCAGTPVQSVRLLGNGAGAASERLAGGIVLSGGDLPAVVSAAVWRVAVLVRSPAAQAGSEGTDGH